MVMALHEASTLLSARQTATHGDVRASGATLGSQGGRNARQRGLPRCVPSLTGSVRIVSLVFGCPGVSRAQAGSGADGAPRRTVGPFLPPSRVHMGLASWYGRRWQGRLTASGARDDRSPRTAAPRTAPLGTHAVVTTLAHGDMVRVWITDRRPHTRRRIRDRSSEAARRLAMVRTGATRVKSAWLTASSPLASLPGLPAPQTSRDVRCPGVVHPRHSVHSVCGCATRSPMGGGRSANGQGDILAEGVFKTEDETEDERRHMGDHRRLTVSPPVPLAAGTAQESAALGEVFVEVGRPREPGPTTAPRRGDTLRKAARMPACWWRDVVCARRAAPCRARTVLTPAPRGCWRACHVLCARSTTLRHTALWGGDVSRFLPAQKRPVPEHP